MAIRAVINYRALTAVASVPGADTPGIQFAQPTFTVDYAELATQVNWRELFLHDLHVNSIRTVYTVSDLFNLADSFAVALDLPVLDAVTVTEQVAVSAASVQADSINLSDTQILEVSPAIQDGFATADSQQIQASSAFTELLATSDLLSINVANVLENQQFSLDDSLTIALSNGLSDSTIVNDTLAYNASTQVQDSLTTNDAISMSSRIDFSDSFSVSESLTFELKVVTAGSRLNKSLIGDIILND